MKVNRLTDIEMNLVGMKGEWRKQKMMDCKTEMLTIWRSNLFMKGIIEMPEIWRRGNSKTCAFRNLNNFQIYESDSAKFKLNKPMTELISINDLSVLDEKIVLDFDDLSICFV